MGDCKTRNETKQDKAETKRDTTQQKRHDFALDPMISSFHFHFGIYNLHNTQEAGKW
jgi:hypothetical protein